MPEQPIEPLNAGDDDMTEWSDDYRAIQAAEPMTDAEWEPFAAATGIEPLNDSEDEPMAFGRDPDKVQRDLDAWVESIPVDDYE